MNLDQHKQKLEYLNFVSRFTDISKALPKFDYDKIRKPPLTYYLSPEVVNNIKQVTKNPRLMVRANLKFKAIDDLLRPYGFMPLASGTNRKTMYCAYDESIVLKVALDGTGARANVLEFKAQKILKPYCAKTFDVTTDGLLALSERVETMTKDDYKQWADDIFFLIFSTLYRGYIMEDVGANFFKNWGIRIGFGPVLLDYPYIYEVDWHKLKCKRIDPLTGNKCLGDIDYDYARGMSELVCTKCGVRYAAKYLAKSIPSDSLVQIHEKGDTTMPLFDTRVKVTSMRGDKVLKRFFAESPAVRTPGNTIGLGKITKKKQSSLDSAIARRKEIVGREAEDIKPSDTNNLVKSEAKEDDEVHQYDFYPKNIYSDIIRFLKHIEQDHGEKVAMELAGKLHVKYYPVGYNDKEPVIIKKGEEWRYPSSKKEIARMSNAMTADEYREKKEKERKIKEEIQKQKDEIIKIDSNEHVIIAGKGKSADEDSKDSVVHQKDGLFPVKAMTREEIEAKEMESRHEDAIVGFPGEPLVDQMKFKEMIPRVKHMVDVKFNHFKLAITDQDEICSELSEQIKAFIFDDIKVLMHGDTDKLRVNVIKTVDERNADCYRTVVDNRGTVLFELTLYPFEEEAEVVEAEPIEDDYWKFVNNKEKLNEYFNKKFQSIDISAMTKLPSEDAKNLVIGALFTSLINEKASHDSPYAPTFKEARKAATEFVNENLTFSEVKKDDNGKDKDVKEETKSTVADQL